MSVVCSVCKTPRSSANRTACGVCGTHFLKKENTSYQEVLKNGNCNSPIGPDIDRTAQKREASDSFTEEIKDVAKGPKRSKLDDDRGPEERNEMESNMTSASVSFREIEESDQEMYQLKMDILESARANMESTIRFQCKCIRLGSYRSRVEDDKAEKPYNVIFTKKGILFDVNHAKEEGIRVELLISSSSIFYCAGYFGYCPPNFLVYRTGKKISNALCKRVGIDGINFKFSPTLQVGNQNNIIFYVEGPILEKDAIRVFQKIHLSSFVSLATYGDAVKVLTALALPGSPDSEHRKGERFDPRLSALKKKSASLELETEGVSPAVATKHASQPVVNQTPTSDFSTVIQRTTKLESHAAHAEDSDDELSLPNQQVLRVGKFSITRNDVYTIGPTQFINDVIIDFWLEHVLEHRVSELDRHRTHLFSTYFYQKLTQKEVVKNGVIASISPEKRHNRVQKWTKKVDIFSKDFVVVPINDHCHWFLAIICYPGLDGPEWISDGSPVPNWNNIGYQNVHPVYQLPPGMKERTDDLPKRAKDKLQRRIRYQKKKEIALMEESNRLNKSSVIEGVDDETNEDELPDIFEPSQEKKGKETDPDYVTLDFGDHEYDDKDEAASDDDEKTLSRDYAVAYSYCDDLMEEAHTLVGDRVSTPSRTGIVSLNASSCKTVAEKPFKEDGDVAIVEADEERTDFRIRQPCILIFDSLGEDCKSRTFSTLREYLGVEYKKRKGKEKVFSKYTMPGFEVNCPQQPNFYDCGLYVLQYFEQFFKTPLTSYLLPLPYTLINWFPPLLNKREEIYNTIRELVEKDKPARLNHFPTFSWPNEEESSVPKTPSQEHITGVGCHSKDKETVQSNHITSSQATEADVFNDLNEDDSDVFDDPMAASASKEVCTFRSVHYAPILKLAKVDDDEEQLLDIDD